MAKLVIADDEGKTQSFPLEQGEVTLGRLDTNRVHLPERNVSRRHARLVSGAEGGFQIEDLGSYLGTKVNGEAIAQATVLNDGDVVEIADFTIKLVMSDAAFEDAVTTPEQALPDGEPTSPERKSLQPGPNDARDRDRSATIRELPSGRGGIKPFPRLILLSPPAPGTEYPLTEAKMRLGRAEDLGLWVNHRSISREHADLEVTAQGVKIVDRGSANGTRINGREAWEQTLVTGDLVQLGQVSFRYVAAGEEYTFESDHTVDLLALEPDKRGPKLIWASAAIVLLGALGGAAALAFRPDMMGWLAGSEPATDPAAEANVAEDIGPAVGAAHQACIDALDRADIQDAEAALATLKEQDAPEATGCAKGLARLERDAQRFAAGSAALKRNSIEEAFAAFSKLSEQSPYRDRSETLRAMARYASDHLEEGQEALAEDPIAALQHADIVLAMGSAAPRLAREQAAQLRVDAENRLDARREAASDRRAARVADRRRPERRPPQRTAPQRTAPERRRPEKTAPAASTEAPPAEEPQGPRCSPLAPDYSQCIVRTLEGRARSPNDLALLIESYRQLGKTPRAVRHMRDFVSRYPSHRLASHYRQVLMRYGQ